MPVIKHPLHAAAAKGSFGKAVTFQQFRGATIARGYAIPTNPRTPAQVGNRLRFKDVSLQFLHLNERQRHGWRQLAIKYAHKKYLFSPTPHEQDFFIASNYYRRMCNKSILYDPPTDTRIMGARSIISATYSTFYDRCTVNFTYYPREISDDDTWLLYMTPPRYQSQLPYKSLLRFQPRTEIFPPGEPKYKFRPRDGVAPPPGDPPILGNWIRIFLLINSWLPSPAFTPWVTWHYI